eukprot:512432_1
MDDLDRSMISENSQANRAPMYPPPKTVAGSTMKFSQRPIIKQRQIPAPYAKTNVNNSPKCVRYLSTTRPVRGAKTATPIAAAPSHIPAVEAEKPRVSWR